MTPDPPCAAGGRRWATRLRLEPASNTAGPCSMFGVAAPDVAPGHRMRGQELLLLLDRVGAGLAATDRWCPVPPGDFGVERRRFLRVQPAAATSATSPALRARPGPRDPRPALRQQAGPLGTPPARAARTRYQAPLLVLTSGVSPVRLGLVGEIQRLVTFPLLVDGRILAAAARSPCRACTSVRWPAAGRALPHIAGQPDLISKTSGTPEPLT